ncbi:hypothetical protein Sjap_012912 [Stephania japonica]|uniref:MHD domain-containing protein n=1 Tax=Stephania japonica TaxID=461633 RepID=A0AAP0NZE0_9MAGN
MGIRPDEVEILHQLGLHEAGDRGNFILAMQGGAGVDTIANGKAGTKAQCLKSAIDALKDGKSVFIDRCNLESEQRAEFVKLGRDQVDVHAVVHAVFNLFDLFVFLDIVESVNLLMSSKGSVLRCDVTGKILMKCFLSGMPDLKLGLNDKIGLEKESQLKSRPTKRLLVNFGNEALLFASLYSGKTIELDDVTFHQCVSLTRFNSEKTVSFVPPDGEFELMKYRITEGVNLPFRVLPTIKELGRTRMKTWFPFSDTVVRVIAKVADFGFSKYAPQEGDSGVSLEVQNNDYRKKVRRLEALEGLFEKHQVAKSPLIEQKLKALHMKKELKAKIKSIREAIRSSTALAFKDELKARKRVLRRLGYITSDNVVELKGKVASEISSADELTLAELMFNGVLKDANVEQMVSLLSCFVWQEKLQDVK